MTNEEWIAQTLGGNENAQEILRNIVGAAFPDVESQYSICDTVIEKFYDWSFGFFYTTDGGGARRWTARVKSWCGRNQKLYALQSLYADGNTDGTFVEQYGGTDKTKDTDNRHKVTKTTFAGVGASASSGNLADQVDDTFADGENTNEREVTYGQKRTYPDGRTWTKILQDIDAVSAPVYDFINGFAQILCPPERERIGRWLPSMQLKIGDVSVGTPAASVVNEGTPMNADWIMSLVMPSGIPALTYDNLYFAEEITKGTVIVQETEKFNRTPAIGDMCIIVCFVFNTIPGDGVTWSAITVCQVTNVTDEWTRLSVIDFVDTKGAKGDKGDKGDSALFPGVSMMTPTSLYLTVTDYSTRGQGVGGQFGTMYTVNVKFQAQSGISYNAGETQIAATTFAPWNKNEICLPCIIRKVNGAAIIFASVRISGGYVYLLLDQDVDLAQGDELSIQGYVIWGTMG